MNNTIKFLVDENSSGKRLDVFLTENISHLTRSFLKKLIEQEQVKLNKKILTSPSTRVKAKDQILNKIKSFSHGEFNQEDLSKKIIEKKILNNEDIFGRGNKLQKIDIDNSYPTYITKNKNKLSDWII